MGGELLIEKTTQGCAHKLAEAIGLFGGHIPKGRLVDQANAQTYRAIPNVPASIHGKRRLSENRSRERVDLADAETKT